MSSEIVIHLKDADIFQGNNLILEDVNLELKKGDFVYLIGKTGTGKSSLLKVLYADVPLEKGEGEIAGFNHEREGRRRIRFFDVNWVLCFRIFSCLQTGASSTIWNLC